MFSQAPQGHCLQEGQRKRGGSLKKNSANLIILPQKVLARVQSICPITFMEDIKMKHLLVLFLSKTTCLHLRIIIQIFVVLITPVT